MNHFEKFEAQQDKLANVLEANGLLHKFKTDSYPMSLTIMQNTAPDVQMALYETETDGVSSRDAKLVLTFPVGEIGVRVYGRLIISDTLMNKIKNHGKKMRDLYLQGYYATNMKPERQLFTAEDDSEDDSENVVDFNEFFESDDDEETEAAEGSQG